MHAHTEQSYCTLMHAHTDCKILPHAKKNVSRTRSNQTPTVSCVHTHHKNLPVHPPRQHAHTHTHASTLTRAHTYIHAHIHNNNTHTGIKTDVGRGGHAHKVKRKVETFERDQVDEVCTCVCERDSVRERETEREKETDRQRESDRERQRDRDTY